LLVRTRQCRQSGDHARWQARKIEAKTAAPALSILPVLAQPLPVPKPSGPGGSCPHGYTSSGSFCVPGAGVQDAIAKPPRDVPVALDRVGLVLPAQRQRPTMKRRRQKTRPASAPGFFFARA